MTSAFQKYTQRHISANLDHLASCLQLWRTHGPVPERTTLATAATNLQTTITTAQQTNQVINVKASNIGQIDCYELITPVPHEYVTEFNGWLPVNQQKPALTPSEISKVNEAFRRARKAARMARDYMIELSKKSSLSLPATGVPTALLPAQQGEKLYVDYFGAFDQDRAKLVLKGYKDICDCFDTKVKLYDVRNTRQGRTFYAACLTAKVSRNAKRRVTSRVIMVMGRAFFSGAIPTRPRAGRFNAQQAYQETSDATVGTFVHELAHGTFHAVDAPPVRPNGSWELNPDMTPGDNFGASPDNDIQSSTPLLDKRLAEKNADIAARNADNYGQFAREYMIMMTAGRG